MCGIAGAFHQRSILSDELTELASKMGQALWRRGPDDAGSWVDEESGIALSHRRLSILDVSAAGHQPMLSACGRYVMVYNGEIYNHLALRAVLERDRVYVWAGHSDTETLLALIAAYGLEQALEKINGMFAIGLWDRQAKTLSLVRDRFGEKPLYYGWQGNSFLFGSELKALKTHPEFLGEIDRGALALFLKHNYVPAPYSIYTGIFKLEAGITLTINFEAKSELAKQYWSLATAQASGLVHTFKGTDTQAIDHLSELLGGAVKGQMLADVPLGGLLSGGIDSSLISSLMQASSAVPIDTFTVGFEDKIYDEAVHARAVAAHIGSHHTELQVKPADALAIIPELPRIYDEPFADSSQLPTYLVMKLVKQQVSVALSGDGADEFFGGYNRYKFVPSIARKLEVLPRFVRSLIAKMLTSVPAERINQAFDRVFGDYGVAQFGDKLHKLGQRVAIYQNGHGIDGLYLSLVSEWTEQLNLVIADEHRPYLLNEPHRWPITTDPVERMMWFDGMSYLPDDILVKVDRAAMYTSLETRAPFLDRGVVEFAWSLPANMKLRGGQGKWLLRQLLERYVPKELTDRPKMGFSVPLDDWLRGPLKDWGEQLLAPVTLAEQGYLNVDTIRTAWELHQAGRNNFGYRLWSVLMFQAWLAEQ